MYLKEKFKVETGKNLSLANMVDHYGRSWEVADQDDGFRLTAFGRLFINAGYQKHSLPVEFRVVVPHRRLIVGVNKPYWPFEELEDNRQHDTPVWSDVADAIAATAISQKPTRRKSSDRSGKGRGKLNLAEARYGLLPGNIEYSNDYTVLSFTFNGYNPDFVLFYTDKSLDSFGGKDGSNIFTYDNAGVEMAIISLGHVASMMEKPA